MTVKELIAKLSELPQDLVVVTHDWQQEGVSTWYLVVDHVEAFDVDPSQHLNGTGMSEAKAPMKVVYVGEQHELRVYSPQPQRESSGSGF